MQTKPFFPLPGGRTATLYSLRNRAGFGADISDWGGAIVNLFVPDRDGNPVDVMLGYGNPQDYLKNGSFFGALIGRVANRISKGTFQLDGMVYQCVLNDSNGKNTLHGGWCYGRRQWQATPIGESTLKLELTSPDGDAGFPGEVKVTVVYQFTEDNALSISYSAETDRPTIFNMTNHAYFNLAGEAAGNCRDHRIRLEAARRTETNADRGLTGACPDVTGTAYDLRHGKTFAEIHHDLPPGLDDNFILDDRDGDFKENVAVVSSDRTGIELALSTTAPGVQFYMGFFLDGSAIGKSGKGYPQFSAFCLETQNWPDAVNHSHFPSARLEPGKPYLHKSVFRFGVTK